MTELFEQALEYSDKGLIPIPVNFKDKTPIVAWSQYLESRPKKYQLRNWFDKPTSLNMANIVGKGSGICVLDIDDPSKYPEDFPVTPTVKTSRGYHLYFKYPESIEIRNTNLPYGDFKADRTLCNIPPSVHPDGTPYEWVISLDTPFAELPSWLLEAVKQRIKLRDNHPIAMDTPWDEDQETNAYAKPWFAEAEELAYQDKGGRNNRLNTMAAKAGSLIAGGHLNENEARQALEDAAKANGEWNENPQEVKATINSGLSAGKLNPRIPTPKEVANDNWTDKGELKYRRLGQVAPENVDWIWDPILARGVVTLIGGYQGVGKSTITLNLAAIVSNGSKWPVSGARAEKKNVVIVSCEDSTESVISPRLLAAGANLDNTIILEEPGFRLDKDIPRLKQMVENIGNVDLIVIDPVGAHLGKADNNSLGDVRNITNQLKELADECHLSVVVVVHLNKNTKMLNALDRFSGSGAWTQAARNAFLVDASDFDRSRLQMSTAKTNLPGAQQITYFCKIKPAVVPAKPDPIKTSTVEWENYTENKDANQVLTEKGGKLGDAIAELLELFQYGDVSREEFDKKTNHMSAATRRRAKELTGVEYIQDGKNTGHYTLKRGAQVA